MILLKKLMPLTGKEEVLILKETVAKEKGHHGQGTTLRIIQGIEEALILKETVAKEKGHHGQGTTLRIIQGIEEALILKEICCLVLFMFTERKDQTMDNKIIVFTME
ncbi:hypothetical protein JHK86_049616 [Glycine max]|nr:hypothetical protein JHK86_049616 [Glycine max]